VGDLRSSRRATVPLRHVAKESDRVTRHSNYQLINFGRAAAPPAAGHSAAIPRLAGIFPATAGKSHCSPYRGIGTQPAENAP
jgi:hypothetical protein